MIVSRVPKSSIIAIKPSKYSCGSVHPSYYSKLIGGLKLGGVGTSMTLNVNGWLSIPPLDGHIYLWDHEIDRMSDQ